MLASIPILFCSPLKVASHPAAYVTTLSESTCESLFRFHNTTFGKVGAPLLPAVCCLPHTPSLLPTCCQLLSTRVNSCQLMSTHVNSCQLMSSHVATHVKSCQLMSTHVNACQLLPGLRTAACCLPFAACCPLPAACLLLRPSAASCSLLHACCLLHFPVGCYGCCQTSLLSAAVCCCQPAPLISAGTCIYTGGRYLLAYVLTQWVPNTQGVGTAHNSTFGWRRWAAWW